MVMIMSSSIRPQARCLICLKFRVVVGGPATSKDNQPHHRYRHWHRLQPLGGTPDDVKSEDVEQGTIEEVLVTTPNDLFAKFLQLTSRYLSLKGITAPILEATKERKDEGGGDIEVFCEGCKDLVSYVCDLYADLEFVRLHLVWKLSQLGGKLTASKKNVSRKLGKGLLKSVVGRLHIKEGRALETFRKALELKCIRKWKDCAPRPVIPSGLFPEHWKHPHSATKAMLMRLIVVFLLASSTMHERTKVDPDPANDLTIDGKHIGRRRGSMKRRVSKRFGGSSLNNRVRIKEDLSNTDVKEEEDAKEDDTHFANFDNEDNGADSDWSGGALSPNEIEIWSNGSDADFKKDGVRRKRKRKMETGLIEVEGDHRTEDQDELELSGSTKPSRHKKPKKYTNTTKPNKTLAKCQTANKIVYTCNTCEKKFNGRTNLLNHLESVHETPEKYLQCWFCPRKFTLLQTLERHRLGKHNGRNMFSCEELPCSEKFWELEKYEEHLKTHITETNTSSQWTLENQPSEQAGTPEKHLGEGGETFGNGENLISKHPASSVNPSDDGGREMRETTQMRMILHCSKCTWCFLDPDLLRLHEIVHDENPKKDFYQCPKCITFFQNVRALLGHFHDFHRKIADPLNPLHECPECGKKMCRKNSLVAHIKRHKRRKKLGPSENVTCSQCGYLAKDPALLETHMKRHDHEHDPNRVFQCSEAGCGVKFNSSVSLEGHIVKVHKLEKKFPCPFRCGSIFATRKDVTSHLRAVHGSHKYVCDVCGKEYKTENSFKRHKKTEHDSNGRTSYICSECGMSYKSQWGLRFHIGSVHTPESEKRFGCPHCPKRYNRMMLLRMHTKTCMKINGVVSVDSSAGQPVSSATSTTVRCQIPSDGGHEKKAEDMEKEVEDKSSHARIEGQPTELKI